MKLVDHFTDFLTDVVDLNATRVSQLEGSIEALKDFIRRSDWEPAIKGFVPQGSWAHKMIIRPVEGAAFDADLLVLIEPVSGWDAREFLKTLRTVFAIDPTYEDKIKRFSHCVTVEYAGERKIDIALCVVDRDGGSSLEVCKSLIEEFAPNGPD